MKKLSNTEAELKKALFIKETCITLDQNSVIIEVTIKIQGYFLNLRLFHKYLIVEYPLCPEILDYFN